MYIWQEDIYPSSDDRLKGILDLVHSEEAQELEAIVTMSSIVYNNLNETTAARLQVCISVLIFYYCNLRKCCN